MAIKFTAAHKAWLKPLYVKRTPVAGTQVDLRYMKGLITLGLVKRIGMNSYQITKEGVEAYEQAD